jgi:hypothetical protein
LEDGSGEGSARGAGATVSSNRRATRIANGLPPVWPSWLRTTGGAGARATPRVRRVRRGVMGSAV